MNCNPTNSDKAMTDILNRLHLKALQEPRESIWYEAMDDIQSLRVRVEALELLIKMRELPQHEDSCQWKEDADGIWQTDCGNAFEFTADGPTENEFRFCPYCGGKISIHEEAQE